MNSKLTTYKQVLNMLSRVINIQYFFFLLIICVSFSRCKKEEDMVPPVVTLLSPLPNTRVDGGFGFFVKGSIIDNEEIKEMQITLTPESANNNSSYFRRILINKSSHDFFEEIIIENDDFIEGNYYLSITASDGYNKGTYGVSLFVGFESTKFLGCLNAVEFNNQTTINWLIPDEAINTVYGTAPVSFGGLAINSIDKVFIIAERDQRVITGRKKKENTTVWSVSNSNTTGTYQYKSLVTINSLIYALGYNNQIEVYSRDGNPQNTITTFYRPIMITKTSNRMFTIEQSATNNYYLGIYNSFGSQLSQIQLDFVPVGLERQDSENIYVIGNKNGAGKLKEYKTQASAFNEVQDFNYEVLSSTYCNGRLYYNSTVGNLYEFSINFNNGVKRAVNVYADLMKCHEPTAQIYYNHNTQGDFGIFDLQSNSKGIQRNYFKKVLGIEFLYSR